MKLRFQVSSCAFGVPVKPGRVLRERGNYAASTRALPLARNCPNSARLVARASRSCVPGCYHMGGGPVPLFVTRAFTLIELLMVIAIVGIIAVLVAPVLIHFRKPDATEAATRQMLDDFARARQLAISERSTVYL